LGLQLVIRFEGELPERFVCGSTRYRVTDTPTRLEDELAALTHPLPIAGWRFQGTDDDGQSHMFDVCPPRRPLGTAADVGLARQRRFRTALPDVTTTPRSTSAATCTGIVMALRSTGFA